MPELPEIETIKSVIEPQIKGITIEDITVNRPEVISYPTADRTDATTKTSHIVCVDKNRKIWYPNPGVNN